eukprot:CAMPEP_0114340836 /NCGR_PEP_ID=MMETSP0101-20121206/8634_1 /TAXON_ID=38822 ORGANISM="Pteridomonas danica, Strain PT" /NCGR_SAMPLE_ID=MMETSP0101 /ASSEMBLY_ACC=CAM_ASM_000211 /LENGTH=247 /DNA_ID=CAMNT_0001474215 /DNA_START=426 /DNA_END=1169 /DNA_ORIENTATION=-
MLNGFKVSSHSHKTNGIGGSGGIYFSIKNPTCYDLDNKLYDEQIIIDFYGSGALEDYKGQHKVDVCIVYAMDPSLVQPVNKKKKFFSFKSNISDVSLITPTTAASLTPPPPSSLSQNQKYGFPTITPPPPPSSSSSSSATSSLPSLPSSLASPPDPQNVKNDLPPLSPATLDSDVSSLYALSRETFKDFSLPHQDDNYYLRSDRIIGVFLITKQKQPSIKETVDGGGQKIKKHGDELSSFEKAPAYL